MEMHLHVRFDGWLNKKKNVKEITAVDKPIIHLEYDNCCSLMNHAAFSLSKNISFNKVNSF